MLNEVGVAELRIGIGFNTEMLWLMETLGLSTLVVRELDYVGAGNDGRRGVGD